MEVWKDIPGYLGYQVSDFGRVRSFRRGKPKILKHWFADGYPYVSPRVNGKTLKRSVHSLVALVFIGPRPDGYETCHNDGNRGNPSANNLRYATCRENNFDKRRHGTFALGEETSCAKLTTADILNIRLDDRVQTAIARSFNISQQQVSKIKLGIRWGHV